MNYLPAADSLHQAGGLPRLDDLAEFAPDRATLKANSIVGFETRTAAARPFSLLRTQVGKRCSQQGWRLIGVTSAEPAAGKSFISLNLAAALSKVETQTVYLFDLDFSRASMAKTLGMEAAPGLADYLLGETDDLRAVGRRIAGTNLAVFATAIWHGSTASLFSGPRFRDLADMLRQVPEGALVLCDLPPVFASDDAMIIAQSLDAYLAVVSSGETNQQQLIETFAMLEPTPRLGTVLNRYNGGIADPYGYNAYSRAYHKYD